MSNSGPDSGGKACGGPLTSGPMTGGGARPSVTTRSIDAEFDVEGSRRLRKSVQALAIRRRSLASGMAMGVDAIADVTRSLVESIRPLALAGVIHADGRLLGGCLSTDSSRIDGLDRLLATDQATTIANLVARSAFSSATSVIR